MEEKEAIAKLREEGKKIYAKLGVAYEKKDWINFSVLSEQLKNIKEDIEKLEAPEQTQEIQR